MTPRLTLSVLLLSLVGCGDDSPGGARANIDAGDLQGDITLWLLGDDAETLATLDPQDTETRIATSPAEGDIVGISAAEDGPVYLAGEVKDGRAKLRVSHELALGEDFEDASAQYTFATPTNGPDSDEQSGLWYLGIYEGDEVPSQALFVPELPAGWIYEGWVELDGVVISTGRFLDPNGPDMAAPHSGPKDGPPFPGEDFLENAPDGVEFPTNLDGSRAFITVEPEDDDDAGPFGLVIVDGTVRPMQNAAEFTFLDNVAGDLPRVTVTF